MQLFTGTSLLSSLHPKSNPQTLHIEAVYDRNKGGFASPRHFARRLMQNPTDTSISQRHLIEASQATQRNVGFSASSESRTRPRRFAPPRYARGLCRSAAARVGNGCTVIFIHRDSTVFRRVVYPNLYPRSEKTERKLLCRCTIFGFRHVFLLALAGAKFIYLLGLMRCHNPLLKWSV